ncbi:hypothetical protein EIK77_007004 [Talaromyces pinophilus]|jgi:hypothetical protein|nr:hypothetical protein EIK77_007004 [Talaromyces pinophilus]
MKKLADDPSPEDDDEPFPADCESNKEACESDKADLDAKLKDCEGKRSASAFSFDSAVCKLSKYSQRINPAV